MTDLEYTPWGLVTNITVGVMFHGRPANVTLPWVCARDAEALIVTAEFIAYINIAKLYGKFGEEEQ